MKKIIVFIILILLVVVFYPKKHSFGVYPGVVFPKCFGIDKTIVSMPGRTDAICYGLLIK